MSRALVGYSFGCICESILMYMASLHGVGPEMNKKRERRKPPEHQCHPVCDLSRCEQAASRSCRHAFS